MFVYFDRTKYLIQILFLSITSLVGNQFLFTKQKTRSLGQRNTWQRNPTRPLFLVCPNKSKISIYQLSFQYFVDSGLWKMTNEILSVCSIFSESLNTSRLDRSHCSHRKNGWICNTVAALWVQYQWWSRYIYTCLEICRHGSLTIPCTTSWDSSRDLHLCYKWAQHDTFFTRAFSELSQRDDLLVDSKHWYIYVYICIISGGTTLSFRFYHKLLLLNFLLPIYNSDRSFTVSLIDRRAEFKAKLTSPLRISLDFIASIDY